MANEHLDARKNHLKEWAILIGKRNQQVASIEKEVIQLRHSVNAQFEQLIIKIQNFNSQTGHSGDF